MGAGSMQRSDLVSVIIPVYKVEETLLTRCIRSALSQSYPHLQIILVDDGSPDGCGEVCDRLAREDGRIRVYHIPNGGVSHARNLGMAKAEGEYLFFLDADDYLEGDCIETLLALACEQNADCVKCAARHLYEGKTAETDAGGRGAVTVLDSVRAVEALGYMQPVCPDLEITAVWGCLYRKSAVEGISFQDGVSIGEDFLFNYRVFSRANTVICTDRRLYHYIIHPASQMRNGFQASRLEILEAMESLIDRESSPAFRNAAIARYENMIFVLLRMIPPDRENEAYRRTLGEKAKKYRLAVLANGKVKGKVKLALVLSFLGMDTVKGVCDRVIKQ